MTEDEALRAAIARRLRGQLSDAAAADRLAAILFDTALTWRPEEIEVEDADTVIAFALGLREEDPAHPIAVAGPVNEEIAASVMAIVEKRPGVRVYAQWEIARVLHGRFGLDQAVSIERQNGPDGELYLSTWGVAEQSIAHGGGTAALGKVLAVGHHDHVWRCVQFCRVLGLDAYAPADIALAKSYDEKSTQRFTLTADDWIIYDLCVRMQGERHRQMGF